MGIIGSIRKHSGLAVTIVGLAIVAFIIGDLSKNKGGMSEVGKIDGQTITRQHFDMLYDKQEAAAKQQYMQYYGTSTLPAGSEYQLRDQVWNDLLQQTLVGHEMEKLGISVGSEELSDMYLGEFVHQTLKQVFGNPQTGEYDKQYVKQVLDNMANLDTAVQAQLADIQKAVTEDRAMNKYGMLVARSFYMPQAVVNHLAGIAAVQKDVRMARVPFSAVSDEEAVPTDADIKAYYEEHKNEYRVAEEYRQIEYVLFRIAPTKEDIMQIEEEVNKVYEEMLTIEDDELGFYVSTESIRSYDSTYRRASEFAGIDSLIGAASAGSYIQPHMVGNQWVMGKVLSTAMRPDSIRASVIYLMNNKVGQGITRTPEQAASLADSLVRLVRAGMPFDTAVVRYSDSKENLGDMGWALDGTSYGILNEDIVAHNEGDVFSIERPDKLGHIVIKVTGKTAPAKKYRVALIQRPIVASDATEKKAYSDASLFAGSNRNVAEMEAAVREQNLQMGQSDIIAMSHTIDGHPNMREIVRWAFDKETKKGAVAEQVFTLEDNAYAVVALKDIIREGIPTLEQLQAVPQFMNYVTLEKKAGILLERAAKVKGDINDAAVALGTTVDTLTGVSLENPYLGRYGAEPRVLGTIAAQQQIGGLTPVKGYSGIYLFTVDSQNTAEEAPTAAIRAQLEQNTNQKVNKMVYMLRQSAKVSDNRGQHF